MRIEPKVAYYSSNKSLELLRDPGVMNWVRRVTGSLTGYTAIFISIAVHTPLDPFCHCSIANDKSPGPVFHIQTTLAEFYEVGKLNILSRFLACWRDCAG